MRLFGHHRLSLAEQDHHAQQCVLSDLLDASAGENSQAQLFHLKLLDTASSLKYCNHCNRFPLLHGLAYWYLYLGLAVLCPQFACKSISKACCCFML